jgi:hypothetical protein
VLPAPVVDPVVTLSVLTLPVIMLAVPVVLSGAVVDPVATLPVVEEVVVHPEPVVVEATHKPLLQICGLQGSTVQLVPSAVKQVC